jgi:hypothetical protein
MKSFQAENSTQSQKKKIIAAYIFFTLVLAKSSGALYGAFLLITFYYLVSVMPRGFRLGLSKRGWNVTDVIPLFFMVSWIYGAFIGLVRGNEILYVFSNFAGFVTYFSYYLLLWSRISQAAIFNLLMLSALVVCFLNIGLAISYVLFSVDVWNDPLINLLFGSYIGGSSTGQIRMYSVAQIVGFPLFSVAFTRLVIAKNKLSTSYSTPKMNSTMAAFLYFVLSGAVTVIMPASKGFMLAALVILSVIIASWPYRKRWRISIKKILLGIVFAAIFFGVLIASGYINIALVIFAQNDEGNITRFLQLSHLLADINLVGQGLGAVVPGNVRDVDRPYGFELSYINLIHKLGIVSMLLFFGYLISLKRIIAHGKSGPANLKYAAAALGCFSFVFVGIGNPIISSPQMVLLHCIGLFLIRGGSERL